jgi:hypothetical protein
MVMSLYETKPPVYQECPGLPCPALRFDDGAQVIRNELDKEYFELASVELVNKKLGAHIGKYNGIFARLCVLWHCVENVDRDMPERPRPLPALVTENTARRVAKFMREFLLPHAITFYTDVLGLLDDHDHLAAVAGYILARKLDRITNRHVQRGDRTMRKLTTKDIERIFEQLDALGWVTRTPAKRPSDPSHDRQSGSSRALQGAGPE